MKMGLNKILRKYQGSYFNMFKRPRDYEYPEFFRPGLGTENVAPFLRSFVQMVRPNRILEIGAGYTSPFFLEALYNNERVLNDGNLNDFFLSNAKYDPRLIIVDDLSLGEIADDVGLQLLIKSPYVRFVQGVFQGQAETLRNEYGLFDFVWFDCGSSSEYEDFINEYWDICNGYVVFHYTFSNGKPNKNMDILNKHLGKSHQIFSIIEPHKKRQGSISIIKK